MGCVIVSNLSGLVVRKSTHARRAPTAPYTLSCQALVASILHRMACGSMRKPCISHEQAYTLLCHARPPPDVAHITDLAAATTASTVMPNLEYRMSAGALAPNESMPTNAPWLVV